MFTERFFVRTFLAGAMLRGGAGLCILSATGCAEHGRTAVPVDAEQLTSGRGDTMRATAPHGGTAYVLDKSDDKLVWSGQVHTDDKIVVDPEADRITVDGRTVGEPNLKRDHKYAIYFYRPSRD